MASRPRLIAAILGALVLGVLAALVAVPAPPTTKFKVRIALPSTLIASLPHWVAESQGIYERHNLEVRATPINASPEMVLSLMGGEADFLPAVALDVVVAAAMKDPDASPP